MAKFILEVSDEYIREQADSEKMAAKMAASDDKEGALSALFDVIAFSNIKDALDEGETEFTLSIDDMDDDKGRQIFNSTASRFGTMLIIKNAKEKKEKKDKSEGSDD